MVSHRHAEPLFWGLNILKASNLYEYGIAPSCTNWINLRCLTYYPCLHTINNQETRQLKLFHIPICHTNLTKITIKYPRPLTWDTFSCGLCLYVSRDLLSLPYILYAIKLTISVDCMDYISIVVVGICYTYQNTRYTSYRNNPLYSVSSVCVFLIFQESGIFSKQICNKKDDNIRQNTYIFGSIQTVIYIILCFR